MPVGDYSQMPACMLEITRCSRCQQTELQSLLVFPEASWGLRLLADVEDSPLETVSGSFYTFGWLDNGSAGNYYVLVQRSFLANFSRSFTTLARTIYLSRVTFTILTLFTNTIVTVNLEPDRRRWTISVCTFTFGWISRKSIEHYLPGDNTLFNYWNLS